MSDHGRLFQDTYLDLNREEQKEFEASVNNSRKKEEDYRRGGRVTVRSYRRAARVSAPYVLLNSRVSPAGAIEPRPITIWKSTLRLKPNYCVLPVWGRVP